MRRGGRIGIDARAQDWKRATVSADDIRVRLSPGLRRPGVNAPSVYPGGGRAQAA